MRETSTNRQSFSLPNEILARTFELLSRPDLKRIRLVYWHFCDIATPLCFKTLTFHASNQASVESLVMIANSKFLRMHVLEIIHQTGKPLRKFCNFSEWETSIRLANDLKLGSDPVGAFDNQMDTPYNIISNEDWLQSKEEEKKAFYDGYERDRLARNDYSRLLCNTSDFPSVGFTDSERVPSAVESSLIKGDCNTRVLAGAFSRFERLTAFKHKVESWENRWCTSWNGLRIPPLPDCCACEEQDNQANEDLEALQLSYVLMCIGLAKKYLTNFDSVVFHVQGPAFWSPPRLQSLWTGKGHSELTYLRSKHSNAMDAEKEMVSINPIEYEKYDRHLDIIKGGLGSLTQFDCEVNEDMEDGSLFTAAEPFFEFLRFSSNLKRLRLQFGYPFDGGLPVEADHWLLANGDGPKTLLTLLTKDKPWSKLKELKLEIATDETTLLDFLKSLSSTLYSLSLSNVILLPMQGTWDSALPAIARLGNLENLDLEMLCDFPDDQMSRMLFDPDAEIWGEKGSLYDDYKEHLIRDLLREKELPRLDPESFVKEYGESHG